MKRHPQENNHQIPRQNAVVKRWELLLRVPHVLGYARVKLGGFVVRFRVYDTVVPYTLLLRVPPLSLEPC